MKRSSGILMPISALPDKYGIGTLGKSAYEFADFLAEAGQSDWQILPIGITGFGDSPYQSVSAFAGNPYFIDLQILIDKGLLEKAEVMKLKKHVSERKYIDYAYQFNHRYDILRKAYARFLEDEPEDFKVFIKSHSPWLEDFALFMALKDSHNHAPWYEWEKKFCTRDKKALKSYREASYYDVGFWYFVQYEFYKQYNELKAYANHKGIRIIGDLPIYVSEDSVEAWASSEMFLIDENRRVTVVSGCPPDAFSPTGQLWGNPIYDWAYMDQCRYAWWIERIRFSLTIYDVVRIDHFRGFESYWEIPAGDPTAENGKWVPGPGMKLFSAIKEALGDVAIIAEDLGFLTQEVIDFHTATGFPGMKVLQFAFDTREESDYLPHNYDSNCVVYTGTHDNDTTVGWFKKAPRKEVKHAIKYLKLTKREGYHWGFIRGAWSSTAKLAIAPIQDFLGLDDEARINIPSTLGGNWVWQIAPDALTPELAKKIKQLTKLYGR